MTVRIHYETPHGGTATIEREERTYNDDGYVAVFDNPDDAHGTERKVEIPTDRVVRVVHGEQEWSE
jgi:hypothetical protein